MKISDKAKKYLIEKNIKCILIDSKVKIEFNGCPCAGGTKASVKPLISFEEPKNKDEFIYMSVQGFDVYIKDRLYSAFNEDTELKYSKIFLKERLSLKKFDIENISRCAN
ncbi:MAG: hypothetical protein Q4A42_03340 [Tissierellia bacterium]|nr:hypothetical protein [Tissierellia bacterium]